MRTRDTPALEREADRAADKVSRGQAVEPMTRVAAPRAQRMCAACHDEELEQPLQRAAASAAPLADVPAEAIIAARGGGTPLTAHDRRYFEPLFGQDLGAVRLHAGAGATSAARAVDAVAYTIGRDIVFRDGLPDGARSADRRLLAHELAHTVQQSGASAGVPESRAGAAAEREAGGASESAARGEPASVSRGHAPALARQPAEEEAYEEAPLRPLPRARPQFRVIQGGQQPMYETVPDEEVDPDTLPMYQRYYAPEPWDDSLDAMFWRASAADARDHYAFEGGIPRPTLIRGGQAPGFVTDGPEETSIGEFGSVTYQTHQFHLLDALEHAVEGATSEAELSAIWFEFIPDGPLYPLFQPGGPAPSYAPIVRPHLPWGVWIPDNLDPGAVQRTEVFLMAVRRRASAIPSLASSPLAHAEEAEAMEGPSVSGPCYTELRPRATFGGGNARHDEFAELVTHGNPDELLVRAPEGVECQFDGEDLSVPGLLWEVKTGHDFTSDLGLAARGMNPTVLQMIDRLEWQRLKCMFVATRCQYRYQYAFDNCVIARAMREQWANIPPVFFYRAPWSEPCE